jgi:arylsulfatase A-like enzyme
VPTIGGALQEVGYATHAVGKIHLQPFNGGGASLEGMAPWNDGTLTELPANYYGFQTADYVGGHVSYVFGQYRQWLEVEHPGNIDRYRAENAYLRRGEAWRMELPEELHYNQWIADRASDFLARRREEPFYLFCSFPDPHHPFAACRPYSEMYDPASLTMPPNWREPTRFHPLPDASRGGRWQPPENEADMREIMAQTYGMISHVDSCIGQVLQTLEESGQAESTVVAFIADHGEYLGAHNLLHKGPWPVEQLWRIPYIWADPRAAAAGSAASSTARGTVVDDPVSILDVVPTVAELAGLTEGWHSMRGPGARKQLGLPGRSLRPYLYGDTETEARAVLMEYDEDWHEGTPVCRLRGIVDGDWKLVTYAGYREGILIDLANDPHERNNLWDEPSAQDRKCELLATLAERLSASDRFDTYRICGA